MSDIQNRFTAYLLRAIHNGKCNYMQKISHLNRRIILMDAVRMEESLAAEQEQAEAAGREVCCRDEKCFMSGEWKQLLQEQRLGSALKHLTIREQEFVFKRVCLELDFAAIGRPYNLTGNQTKHVYYYAISKLIMEL